MNRDPIIEEVHQTRQKILAECNGDLDQLLDRMKAPEIQDRGAVPTAPPLPAKAYVLQSAESVIRGLVGAIPYVGTALNEAFFDLRARIKQKRLEEFVAYLADNLQTLETDKIDTAYLQSEAFVDFLEDVLIRAAKAKGEEKRRKLAAVLAGRLQHSEGTSIDDHFDDRFLDLLLSLSEVQVRILSKHAQATEEREDVTNDTLDAGAEYRQPSFYGLPDSEYRFLVQDLISKALLYDGGMNYLGAEVFQLLKITELGRAFVRFLEQGAAPAR